MRWRLQWRLKQRQFYTYEMLLSHRHFSFITIFLFFSLFIYKRHSILYNKVQIIMQFTQKISFSISYDVSKWKQDRFFSISVHNNVDRTWLTRIQQWLSVDGLLLRHLTERLVFWARDLNAHGEHREYRTRVVSLEVGERLNMASNDALLQYGRTQDFDDPIFTCTRAMT